MVEWHFAIQKSELSRSDTLLPLGIRLNIVLKNLAEMTAILHFFSIHKTKRDINVTSFSSISYYNNVRLISKMHLEQNSCSITLYIDRVWLKHQT